jgi:hypothetical protein
MFALLLAHKSTRRGPIQLLYSYRTQLIKFLAGGNGLTYFYPNHSDLYATHQLRISIGIVATIPQTNGRATSAIKPSSMNIIQKTFRSIWPFRL